MKVNFKLVGLLRREGRPMTEKDYKIDGGNVESKQNLGTKHEARNALREKAAVDNVV